MSEFFGRPAIVTRSPRPGGDAGARQTLAKMLEQIKSSSFTPQLVTIARNLVGMASRRDRASQIGVIREWIAGHTRWVPDPIGQEYLVAPELMLARIVDRGVAPGDCDDVAMLAGALLRAGGIRARLVAVGFSSDRRLSHVFVQGYDGKEWLSIDTTKPSFSSAAPVRALILEVR